MIERRGSRFALEVLFLVALATALTLARRDAVEIAGGMFLGWVIVAAIEWAAWRSEPHYGSGLPPRYYVPTVSLPPAQPLEQVATAGYPDASRDEAPTWIAPAALRAEVLGEWPVAPTVAVVEEVVEVEAPQPEPVPEPEPEPVLEAEVVTPDPWDDLPELPAAPLGELPVEPQPEPEVQAPAADVEPEPTIDVVLTRSAQGVARYHLDPLADPPPKRRFGRSGGGELPAAIEVPARPEGVRPLPGRFARQD